MQPGQLQQQSTAPTAEQQPNTSSARQEALTERSVSTESYDAEEQHSAASPSRSARQPWRLEVVEPDNSSTTEDDDAASVAEPHDGVAAEGGEWQTATN